MDPRKPIHRPDEGSQDIIRQIAHAHLMECTTMGAKALGCSGASFVMLGIAIWAAELAELDRRAAAQMLAAIADLYDPASNDTKKRHAEKRRRQAVDRLHAAVDISMAKPAGTA